MPGWERRNAEKRRDMDAYLLGELRMKNSEQAQKFLCPLCKHKSHGARG